MESSICFEVPGIPAPGGSKRGFLHKRTGRVIVTDDCRRNKDWRAVVALVASEHIKEPLAGPVSVTVTFFMPRPKSHFGKRGLKLNAPTYHTVRPDSTKLWRAAEDALKGIAWFDDAQVVRQLIEKRYGDTPGAAVEIRKEVPDAR